MAARAVTAFSRGDFDWVVVGAGLTGSTLAERIASQLGQRVLVIDRRSHVAGNAYDSPDQAGTLVHRYGAHIFHTKSQIVWHYLSNFTSWYSYEHRGVGSHRRRTCPITLQFEHAWRSLHRTAGTSVGFRPPRRIW